MIRKFQKDPNSFVEVFWIGMIVIEERIDTNDDMRRSMNNTMEEDHKAMTTDGKELNGNDDDDNEEAIKRVMTTRRP